MIGRRVAALWQLNRCMNLTAADCGAERYVCQPRYAMVGPVAENFFMAKERENLRFNRRFAREFDGRAGFLSDADRR